MPESDLNGAEQADRSFVDTLWIKRAELLWGLVIVIMLLTFVNPVVLIGAALAIATVAAGWAGFHELLDRAKQDEALREVAPLRATEIDRRQPGTSPAPAQWQGHHAA